MAKQKTYSAITRSTTSWSPITGRGEITWDCGHKHHRAITAYMCLRSMGDAACAYGAQVEESKFGHIIDSTELEAQLLRI